VNNLNVEKKEDGPSQLKAQSLLEKNDKVENLEKPLIKRRNKKRSVYDGNSLIDKMLHEKPVRRRGPYKTKNKSPHVTNKLKVNIKPKTTESVNTKENKISSTPAATIADEYIESSSISEEYIEESEETLNASQDIKLHFDDDIVSSEDEDELCFKNKKKPKKWTQEETDALLDGVSKFGRGKWVEIYKDKKNIFKNRRKPRDLSDKMRIIDKKSAIYKNPDTIYTLVDETCKPILDRYKKEITIHGKFPHEAALLVVKTFSTIYGNVIRLTCDDDNDSKALHKYKVFQSFKDRPRVRKISGKSKKRVDGP
jgi:hypothetical protein